MKNPKWKGHVRLFVEEVLLYMWKLSIIFIAQPLKYRRTEVKPNYYCREKLNLLLKRISNGKIRPNLNILIHKNSCQSDQIFKVRVVRRNIQLFVLLLIDMILYSLSSQILQAELVIDKNKAERIYFRIWCRRLLRT